MSRLLPSRPTWKAFVVTGRTFGGSATGTATVTIPSTAEPGNLLLVVGVSQVSNSTLSVASSPNWAMLAQAVVANRPTIGCAWGVAGSAGALTLSGSTSLAWSCTSLRGWNGVTADLKAAGANNYGAVPVTALDPGYPAGVEWLCFTGFVNSARSTPSVLPSGFGNQQSYHVNTTRASIDTVDRIRTGAQPSANWQSGDGYWSTLTIGARAA